MVNLKHITAASLLLASSAQALAESATWAMFGVCDGQDAPENHAIQLIEKKNNPGLPPDLWIVGVQARVWPQDGYTFDRNGYMFAGDSDMADILAWGRQLQDGSWEIDTMYPAGFAMRWDSGHVDLHFPCYPVGLTWTGRYTIFYGSSKPSW